MMRLRSKRGSVTVAATLALMVLVAVSLAATVALVAAHARRVKHQEDGLQALYLAEMGVEEVLARAASGDVPEELARTVERIEAPEAAVGAAEATEPSVVGADVDSRLLVGTYEATVRSSGTALAIRSRGVVATPAGMSVSREVDVRCRRVRGAWRVERWERVP